MTDYELYKEQRILSEANYIVSNTATLRDTGQMFGVSRTTISNDIKELQQINLTLYEQVREVLDANLSDRARRGGTAKGTNSIKKRINYQIKKTI